MSELNENIGEKYKEKRNPVYFFIKHHGDLIFLSIFIIFFAYGIHFLIIGEGTCDCAVHARLTNYNSNSFFVNEGGTIEDKFYINEFIFIIVPLIATIITIGISIPDSHIFGIEYSDFRRIRSDYEFSLTSMILISVSILVLCVLMEYLDFFWITIYLNAVSLFYCVYFIVKEIPILAKKENRLYSIIRKSNNYIIAQDSRKNKSKEEGNHKSTYSDRRRNYLNDLKRFFLFYFGINKAYKILYNPKTYKKYGNKYKNDLLDDLLYQQTNYLNELYKNLFLIKNINDGTFKNFSVSEAIAMSVDNITQILHNNDESKLLDILIDANNYKAISNAVDSLYLILKKTDLFKCYEDDIRSIIFNLIPYETPENTNEKRIYIEEQGKNEFHFKENVSASLAHKSLNSNSIWYFDMLKLVYDWAKELPSTITYGYISENFIVYLSILLYFESNKTDAPESFKAEINNLYIDQWKSYIKNCLTKFKDYGIENKKELLVNIHGIYSATNSTTLTGNKVREVINGNIDVSFDSGYIMAWWFCLLSPTECKKVSLSSVIQLLELQFFELFNSLGMVEPILKSYSKDIVKYFSFYDIKVSNHFSKKSIKKEQDHNKFEIADSDENNFKVISHLQSRIGETNKYFHASSSDGEFKQFYICFEHVNYTDIKMVYDMGPDSFLFNSLFDSWLKELIKEKPNNLTICDSNGIDNILKLNNPWKILILNSPFLQNDGSRISKEDKAKINSFKTVPSMPLFKYDLFFEDGAIQFDARITEKPFYRSLTTNEINDYIDKECKVVNGTYKFNSQFATQTFYSRNDLFNEIKNNIIMTDMYLEYRFTNNTEKKIVIYDFMNEPDNSKNNKAKENQTDEQTIHDEGEAK